jgi:hypothetical protein
VKVAGAALVTTFQGVTLVNITNTAGARANFNTAVVKKLLLRNDKFTLPAGHSLQISQSVLADADFSPDTIPLALRGPEVFQAKVQVSRFDAIGFKP